MNEQRQIEAKRRLEDEERIRRMREGGETMKAQLEMEEAERSRRGESGRGSELTPQEQRYREEMERQRANSGLGETQQAQMAMWGRESGSRSTMSSGQGRYEEPRLERASSGEYFTAGPGMGRAEEQMRPEWQGQRSTNAGEQRMHGQDERLERASSGSSFTSGPDVDRMMAERRASERARYGEPPLERASSGEYFTAGPDVNRMAEQRQTERVRHEPGAYEQAPTLAGEQRMHERGERLERASSGSFFTGGPDISRGAGRQMAPERESRSEHTGEYFTTGMDVTREGGIGPSEQAYGEPGPQERASSGSYFSGGPEIRGREGQQRTYEQGELQPASRGTHFTGGGDPRLAGERRMPQREERLERASSGEYFTSGPRGGGMEGGESMQASGRSYAAGTGSMYRPDQPPLERASTGEYFTSGPVPSGHARGGAYEEAPSGYYAQGQGPSQQEEKGGIVSQVTSGAKEMTQKVSEKARSMGEGGGITSTVTTKGRDVSHMVTEKVKAAESSTKAEDFANRAGEVIGRALRKTVSITKEMSSGLKKGLEPKNKSGEEGMERQASAEGQRMAGQPRYTEETTKETRKVVRSEEER